MSKTRMFWVLASFFITAFLAITILVYKLQESPSKENPFVQALKNDDKIPDYRRPAAAKNTFPDPEKINLQPINDLKTLEVRYHGKFHLDVTADGQPFRLSGRMPLFKSPGEKDEEILAKILHQVGPLLNIDQPDQLKNPKVQTGTLGTITLFQQIYEEVPVQGGEVRVHQDSEGNVFLINSSYVPQVTGIDINPVVTPEQAMDVARNHALTMDSLMRPPNVQTPAKVIYQKSLYWKIFVTQPWLGAQQGHSLYFINAHHASAKDPSTFARLEGAID